MPVDAWLSVASGLGKYISLAGLGSRHDLIDQPMVASAFDYFIDQAVEGIIVIAPEAALAHAADRPALVQH